MRTIVYLFAAATTAPVASAIEDDVLFLLQRGMQFRSLGANALSQNEANAPGAEENRSLCEDGRLLPELYVLGAQKSATTSLAYDLMHAGILSAAGGTKKEFHFFDSEPKEFAAKDPSEPSPLAATRGSSNAPEGNEGRDELYLQRLRKRWLQELPACPIDVEKRVSADFTPRNLRLTPLPPGVHPSESVYQGFPNASNGEVMLPDAPHALRALYGAKSYRVTLVAMLREPVARMTSLWFDDNCITCRALEKSGRSFENVIEDVLREAQESPPKYADLLWGGMYGSQLESYLTHWPADQLVVVPFLQYVKLNKAAIFQHLSARLGVPLAYDESIDYMWKPVKNSTNISNDPTVASNWNSDPHPKVAEVLSSQLRQRLDAFMSADKRKLVQVLDSARRSGAWLAGFDGSNDSEIEAWLEDSW